MSANSTTLSLLADWTALQCANRAPIGRSVSLQTGAKPLTLNLSYISDLSVNAGYKQALFHECCGIAQIWVTEEPEMEGKGHSVC